MLKATPHTVLLIDDDPVVTLLLRHALKRSDRSVVTAASWAEARAKIEAIHPAVIVLDLVLPDADGRDVLVALRNGPSTRGIPVFMLSSGTGQSIPDAECIALGATGFLRKPFKPEDVAAAVEDALRGDEDGSGQEDSTVRSAP